MKNREISIDVLRGLAIVGMVLSGTISRNADLPAWLYHAQIAPPDFVFNPALPGITWVDLVFPFFLFAMGMAFPFSLNRSLERGTSYTSILGKTALRALKLFAFAVMLGHLSPFHYPQEMGWLRYALGMVAFGGFFLAFARFPQLSRHESKLNLAGFALLVLLLVARVHLFGLSFSIHRNDIIILVLANMALFGAAIWLFTRSNGYARLGIMALYFALRLTHGIDDSWNKMLWDFTPFKWMAASFPALYDSLLTLGVDLKRTIFYNPEYLKYLMIVIPGSIAGDIVYKGIQEKVAHGKNTGETIYTLLPWVLLTCISINLWGLLSRNLSVVWLANIATALFLGWSVHKSIIKQHKQLCLLLSWSVFWLLLGLVFEAWQGGIKKDSATISYFFLTSGLAGFSIVIFRLWEPLFRPGRLLGFNTLTGMNPMLGYVAAAYLVMPVLYMLQILPWMDLWHTHQPWWGVLRGVLLTTLAIVVTMLSVKRKYFWKT